MYATTKSGGNGSASSVIKNLSMTGNVPKAITLPALCSSSSYPIGQQARTGTFFILVPQQYTAKKTLSRVIFDHK
jgi:hypothetical protein